jgi:hypothetical protein
MGGLRPLDEFDSADKFLQRNGNSGTSGKESYCDETGRLFPIAAICTDETHECKPFQAFAFRWTSPTPRQDSSEFAACLLGKMANDAQKCRTKMPYKNKNGSRSFRFRQN